MIEKKIRLLALNVILFLRRVNNEIQSFFAAFSHGDARRWTLKCKKLILLKYF